MITFPWICLIAFLVLYVAFVIFIWCMCRAASKPTPGPTIHVRTTGTLTKAEADKLGAACLREIDKGGRQRGESARKAREPERRRQIAYEMACLDDSSDAFMADRYREMNREMEDA